MPRRNDLADVEHSLRTSSIVKAEPLVGSTVQRARLSVSGLMTALSTRRKVFHSEADFQHAFAWELQRQLPDAEIRLERRVTSAMGPLHVDIVADLASVGLPWHLAIELKYKTRATSLEEQGEPYGLQGHGAEPIGRYLFLKDVQRLEEIHLQHEFRGWAVLLTNDRTYWADAGQRGGISAEFNLCDGTTCGGKLQWGSGASSRTRSGREAPINLGGRYRLAWSDYSESPGVRHGKFRYLAIEVPAS